MKHFWTYFVAFVVLVWFGGSGCALIEHARDSGEMAIEQSDSPVDTIQRRNMERAIEERELEASRNEQVRWAKINGELVVGMEMKDVRSTWGEPKLMEVAGDPKYGNQRWVYPEGISQRWGVASSRILYFEDGRLAGWETTRRR